MSGRRGAHADVRHNAAEHGPARVRGRRRIPAHVVRGVHRQPGRPQRRRQLPEGHAQAPLPRHPHAAAPVGTVSILSLTSNLPLLLLQGPVITPAPLAALLCYRGYLLRRDSVDSHLDN
jgi:hypothetical protein